MTCSIIPQIHLDYGKLIMTARNVCACGNVVCVHNIGFIKIIKKMFVFKFMFNR